MMTENQIEAIKRIFDKCIEVNKKGRAEVFFDWHPHTSQVDVSIHVPNWNIKRWRTRRQEKASLRLYTEQGVSTLSVVLRSEVAVRASVQIIRAFVEMRHLIAVPS